MIRNTLAAILIAALFAAPAADLAKAKDDKQKKNKNKSQKQSSQKYDISGGGKIIRTKKIDLRGTPDQHLIGLVRMKNDTRRVVDLGRVDQYRDIDLRSGDSVFVRGNIATIGKTQVLMASQVEANGEEVDVQRADRRAAGSRYRSVRQSPRLSGSGKIIKQKKVRTRDGEDHVVLLVETKKGQRRVADVGPVRDLRDMRLQEGDRVKLEGRVMTFGDRELLMADRVSDGDRDVEIDRPRERAGDTRYRDTDRRPDGATPYRDSYRSRDREEFDRRYDRDSRDRDRSVRGTTPYREIYRTRDGEELDIDFDRDSRDRGRSGRGSTPYRQYDEDRRRSQDDRD